VAVIDVLEGVERRGVDEKFQRGFPYKYRSCCSETTVSPDRPGRLPI
jgi:hypothetical protein